MIKTISTTPPEVVNLEFALPNAGSAADAILAAALGFCAQKMQVASSDAALKLLKQADRGAGKPGVLTTAEREELGRLRKENRTLRMERDILKQVHAYTGPRSSF